MKRTHATRPPFALASLVLAALLSGCSALPTQLLFSPSGASSRYILLPDTDATPGGLEVRAAQGVQRISQPYERISVDPSGAISQDTTSDAAVRASYPVLFSMPIPRLEQPAPPPPPPPPPPLPPSSSIILLPQPDGSPSAVVVRTPQGEQQVSRPYEMALVGDGGALTLGETSAEEVNQRFPDLIGLQLPPPERFTLQFRAGTSQLTPDSMAMLATVLERATARPGGEIVVTGHTDRQGTEEANDRLSLQRAQTVRNLLVARGFNAQLVEAVGRGEREPLVPTDDGVAEPRNRRVELLLR
jgi:OmpA-OmpF porin, OOP family